MQYLIFDKHGESKNKIDMFEQIEPREPKLDLLVYDYKSLLNDKKMHN